MMDVIKELRRLAPHRRDPLQCLGCGHEHNCGIHGCAIIRAAVDLLKNQAVELSASQQRERAAVEERRLLKRVCGALSCLLKGIDGQMVYNKVLPMARKALDEYYTKYPPATVALDGIGPQAAGEGEVK